MTQGGTRPVDGRERHVGIIGHGAIGRALAGALLADTARRYVLTLVDQVPVETGPGITQVRDFLEDGRRPDLVVEAAGHAAASTLVPRLLEAGMPVVLASVGALADDALRERLEAAARAGGTRLILPAGAVGGLDYVRTVCLFGDAQVRYTSRKPPEAWRKELAERGVDEAAITAEHVLFEGSAREAARLFPQNLNVAATLALAGVGMDATRVRVVVDPQARGNSHEVDIEGPLGRARFEFRNAPSPDNPKTSRITAVSLHDAVEGFFSR